MNLAANESIYLRINFIYQKIKYLALRLYMAYYVFSLITLIGIINKIK